MLQNKKFIGVLIALLVFVVGYNIRYFSNKEGGAVIEAEQITDIGRVDTSPEDSDSEEDMELEEDMAMEEDMGMGLGMGMAESDLPSRPPRPPLASQPIQLASIETLKEALPPFSPEGMKRNPFLTEKEASGYREKPLKKRAAIKRTVKKTVKADEAAEPPISSADIKMIYRLEEETYVWIRGRARREGEAIGKDRILKINTDSILLERGGKSTTLFMDRDPEAVGKGVQVHFEE